MRKPSTAHRSRRAPPLKDSDYDHEINLVDHAAEAVTPQALSPEPGQQPEEPEQPTEQRPALTTQSQPQPQPEAAAEQEQEQEQEPDAGEGPSSSHEAPARNRSPRRSTSGTSASSRRSKKASKKAASQESLAGHAAVPQFQLTGENFHKSMRSSARENDAQHSDRRQNLRHSMGHDTHSQMQTAPNAASQPLRPPLTYYTKMKEEACSVGFPCSPQKPSASWTLPTGRTLLTSRVPQASTLHKFPIQAGCGYGPNGTSIRTKVSTRTAGSTASCSPRCFPGTHLDGTIRACAGGHGHGRG